MSSNQHSRLYGIYIHNMTTHDHRTIALEVVNKFMQEKAPLKYEYGDVLALQPNHLISEMVAEIMGKNGYIVQMIAPNQLYRLMDRLVVHYVFTQELITQQESERHVYDWEVSHRMTLADLRHTRFIKTFFMD